MSAPCPTFGFIVRLAPNDDTNARRRKLTERLVALGLAVNDGGRGELVVTRDGSQATDADRHIVIQLLTNDLNAFASTVSDLVDLSY